MMKKFFVILAAFVLLFSAGCASTPAETTTTPVPQTTAPAVQVPEAPATVPADTEPQAVFTPITLVDNENICVKITGVDAQNLWGYTLKVFIENKTDKDLMFTVRDVSVNGFMCDPYWASSVSSGMKSNTEIHWLPSSFEANGITQVDQIDFTLHVYDSNDFMAEDVVNEKFSIQP